MYLTYVLLAEVVDLICKHADDSYYLLIVAHINYTGHKLQLNGSCPQKVFYDSLILHDYDEY